MTLSRAGLGLLCYRVEVGENYRNGNETHTVYTLHLTPAYPEKHTFTLYPQCKVTTEIKKKINGVCSGAVLKNTPTNVMLVPSGAGSMDNYKLCEPPGANFSSPKYRKIPVENGWTYLVCDPQASPAIHISLQRAFCANCQT